MSADFLVAKKMTVYNKLISGNDLFISIFHKSIVSEGFCFLSKVLNCQQQKSWPHLWHVKMIFQQLDLRSNGKFVLMEGAFSGIRDPPRFLWRPLCYRRTCGYSNSPHQLELQAYSQCTFFLNQTLSWVLPKGGRQVPFGPLPAFFSCHSPGWRSVYCPIPFQRKPGLWEISV